VKSSQGFDRGVSSPIPRNGGYPCREHQKKFFIGEGDEAVGSIGFDACKLA
jgi:hypothetical protein